LGTNNILDRREDVPEFSTATVLTVLSTGLATWQRALLCSTSGGAPVMKCGYCCHIDTGRWFSTPSGNTVHTVWPSQSNNHHHFNTSSWQTFLWCGQPRWHQSFECHSTLGHISGFIKGSHTAQKCITFIAIPFKVKVINSIPMLLLYFGKVVWDLNMMQFFVSWYVFNHVMNIEITYRNFHG
jgi:hypothetical protein